MILAVWFCTVNDDAEAQEYLLSQYKAACTTDLDVISPQVKAFVRQIHQNGLSATGFKGTHECIARTWKAFDPARRNETTLVVNTADVGRAKAHVVAYMRTIAPELVTIGL